MQFDVTMARLKAEYGTEAVYEQTDYSVARWIKSDDKKKLDEFQKQNVSNMALDAEGNLIFLATSEWRLSYTLEQWPAISALNTMEHSGTASL